MDRLMKRLLLVTFIMLIEGKRTLIFMNEARKKATKKHKIVVHIRSHISATKNPLKFKGFRKHEAGFEQITTHKNTDQ